MATALQQKKLRQLFEQSMPNGGLKTFRENWEQSLGVRHREKQTLDESGEISGRRFEQYYDPEADLFRDEHRSSRECDATGNWQIGEVCSALMGPRWKETFEQKWQGAANQRFEGFGGDVSSGMTPYVTASLDVVAGLLNARALARAKDPEWIWDKVVNVQEATGEGGFEIGNRLDPSNFDGTGTDLADGQSPPTSKDVPTRIHRNRSLRQSRRVKVNKWKFKDDLTGQVMETVDQNSLLLISERERKVADAVLGVSTGTVLGSGASEGINGNALAQAQDGLNFFPYQTGIYGTNANANNPAQENGVTVANFANDGTATGSSSGDGQGLTNYLTLVRALQVLTANKDPFTQLPVNINMMGMQFIIPTEAAKIQLEYLLQAKALWQIANFGFNPGINSAATIGTANVSDYNLVEKMKLQLLTSQFWANRAITAGLYKVGSTGTAYHINLTNNVGDTYATPGSIMSAYWMGHYKDALSYWQREPFNSVQVPLGSVEYGEQCVLCNDFHERGQVYWRDPRICWRTWA